DLEAVAGGGGLRLLRRLLGDQIPGDDDHGGGAAVRGPLQRDLHVVAFRQLADHEQAELDGALQVEVRRVGDPRVDLGELLVGHAEAAVLDVDGEAAGDEVAADLHDGVGRGEGHGVLDQL